RPGAGLPGSWRGRVLRWPQGYGRTDQAGSRLGRRRVTTEFRVDTPFVLERLYTRLYPGGANVRLRCPPQRHVELLDGGAHLPQQVIIFRQCLIGGETIVGHLPGLTEQPVKLGSGSAR